MSYSISVTPFNAVENNQIWEKIFNGKFLEEIEKEIVAIDKELIELDENPDIIIDYKLQNREETLNNRREHLLSLKRDIADLKSALADDKADLEIVEETNDVSIKQIINGIDNSITGHYTRYYNEIGAYGPHYPFHVFFSALFKIVLDIDVQKDQRDTLSLLPTVKWTELYKKIDASAVKKAITAIGDDPENLEVQKFYFALVKDIRDVLKNCLDTKSEIQVSDELYDINEGVSVYEKRVQEIIDMFIKKII